MAGLRRTGAEARGIASRTHGGLALGFRAAGRAALPGALALGIGRGLVGGLAAVAGRGIVPRGAELGLSGAGRGGLGRFRHGRFLGLVLILLVIRVIEGQRGLGGFLKAFLHHRLRLRGGRGRRSGRFLPVVGQGGGQLGHNVALAHAGAQRHAVCLGQLAQFNHGFCG